MKNKICKPDSVKICGKSIDLGDVTLGGDRSNLVYLDKVFSYNNATGCPLPFHLKTGCGKDNFDVIYETKDCRFECSCETCIIDETSTFIIESATATLDLIRTKPEGNICPNQVTINGEHVDSVTFANHRYTVDATDIIAAGQKQRCLDLNQPTRFFFLIRNVGPWEFRATYILKGIVNSHGRTCRFKAIFTNEEDSFSVICNNCSNFAIPDVALPCSINGVFPEISFQFTGKIKMVNPKLSVRCHRKGHPPIGKDESQNTASQCLLCPPCPPCPTESNCSLVLTSKLIIEPTVQLEVIRKTLFCVNGREVLLPCDQDLDISEEQEICDEEEPDICERHENVCRNQDDICDTQNETCSKHFYNDFCTHNQSRFYDVFGCGSRDVQRSCKNFKTAFQYHGSNGCSW